jgi:hypothetical protein
MEKVNLILPAIRTSVTLAGNSPVGETISNLQPDRW